MQNSIRLLLVDAPRLTRRCLATALNRRRDLQVVGESDNGEDARVQAARLRPDVMVVEPNVPGGGASFLADLHRDVPETAVIVLTAGGEDGLMGDSLESGARGYLQKTCEPAELARAVVRVHGGEMVVSATPAPQLARDLQARETPHLLADLTTRERDVLRLVALGRTNGEIARTLCITEHTTKGYLAALLRKLAAKNRVHLAACAFQSGLAVPSEALKPFATA